MALNVSMMALRQIYFQAFQAFKSNSLVHIEKFYYNHIILAKGNPNVDYGRTEGQRQQLARQYNTVTEIKERHLNRITQAITKKEKNQTLILKVYVFQR